MSAPPTPIAVVGLGKIARDQHLPAIAGNSSFSLAATVDPVGPGIDGVPHFPDLDALLDNGPKVQAISLCTPPQLRHALAKQALELGLHVLLEKPPGASLGEVADLLTLDAKSRATLFATWHSRFAAGVAPAKSWLEGRKIRKIAITWREDVRRWHPGQAWIWEPGGLGVFDPGINALSILTEILRQPVLLDSATMIFPQNRAAPIAAKLTMQDTLGSPITMDLDWRQTGPQTWDIVLETDGGLLTLSKGGAELAYPDEILSFDDCEYPALYEHFRRLIDSGRSDVDVTPFRLVADAFLKGKRETTAPFFD